MTIIKYQHQVNVNERRKNHPENTITLSVLLSLGKTEVEADIPKEENHHQH
nr:hypothetical protein [uncultured Fluviicola sp.]